MTARERVARAWHAGSDHAAYEPFGGPLCNCWQVSGRILPMLRDAFDDGWYARAVGAAPGGAWFDVWTDGLEQANPYAHETEEDRHVDQ